MLFFVVTDKRIPSWHMDSPNSTPSFPGAQRPGSWPGGSSLPPGQSRCASPPHPVWSDVGLRTSSKGRGSPSRYRRWDTSYPLYPQRCSSASSGHQAAPARICLQNTGPGNLSRGLLPPRISRSNWSRSSLSNRHTVLVPWLPPSYVNTPKKG